MKNNFINRAFFLFLFIAAIFTNILTASGETISGSEEKNYQTALANWLSGKDEIALRAFSELARDENRAAQLFLAQVEANIWLHHHVTKKLSRKSRIALLRNPNGLSGRSWLYSAASDTPLAEYLLDARKPVEDTKTALKLLDANELSSGLPLISRIKNAHGEFVSIKLLLHENVIAYSSGYLREWADQTDEWLKSLSTPKSVSSIKPITPLITESIEIQETIRSHAIHDEDNGILWVRIGNKGLWNILQGDRSKLKELGIALLKVEQLEAISSFVKRQCGGNAAEALATLQIASYQEPLFYSTFSPVQSLLSTTDYQRSDRFESDVLRRLNFSKMSRNLAKRLNTCAYRLITGGNLAE